MYWKLQFVAYVRCCLQSSNIVEKNLVDARRKLACHQRSQLSDLYYGRNRPSTGCCCVYLVSADFVSNWKNFIRSVLLVVVVIRMSPPFSLIKYLHVEVFPWCSWYYTWIVGLRFSSVYVHRMYMEKKMDKAVLYFRAYTPHTHITCTCMYPAHTHSLSKNNWYTPHRHIPGTDYICRMGRKLPLVPWGHSASSRQGGWGSIAKYTTCETTAVPAMLQPQQSVVTGEIGPDAINVCECNWLEVD